MENMKYGDVTKPYKETALNENKPAPPVKINVLVYQLSVEDQKYRIIVDKSKAPKEESGVNIPSGVACEMLLKLIKNGTVTKQGNENPLTNSEKKNLSDKLESLELAGNFGDMVVYKAPTERRS
ncbi:MAG: hypothetical protein V1492_00280 [Candidatus Micrarchaeota archaeon]